MGFGVPMLWVMGYGGIMGYGPRFPANGVGNSKILWVIMEYGLWGLWVMRESTVAMSNYDTFHPKRSV